MDMTFLGLMTRMLLCLNKAALLQLIKLRPDFIVLFLDVFPAIHFARLAGKVLLP